MNIFSDNEVKCHSGPIMAFCCRRMMENGHFRKEQLCTYNKSSCATIMNFSAYTNFSGKWNCYFFDCALYSCFKNDEATDAISNILYAKKARES